MDFSEIVKRVRVVACDSVVISESKLLLVRRAIPPFKGWWCLPGGIMAMGETCRQCAERELLEETGFRGRATRLVGVYDDPKRDSRQTVAVAFLAKLTGGKVRKNSEASEIRFFPLGALPKRIAFDHRKVIRDAVKARAAAGRRGGPPV